ncbi:MAG: 50S ribosomal protein L10 [Candidatus Brocadiia bacterium]
MSKKIKQLVVKELSSRYREMDNCIVVNYRGIKSNQASELRSYLRETGILMNVVKNTMVKHIGEAAGSNALKKVESMVEGPAAIIYPGVPHYDVVNFAKRLITWRDKHKMLEIKGGYIEGRPVSIGELKALAAMPSREVILTMIAGLLNSPMRRLAVGLSETAGKFARAMKQYSDKKTDAPAPPAAN